MTATDLPPTERPLRELLLDSAAAAAWLGWFFRHELLHLRAVRGLQLEASALFDRVVSRPLAALIAARLSHLRAQDVPPRNLAPMIRDLQREVDALVSQGVAEVQRTAESRAREVGQQEVRWVYGTVEGERTAAPASAVEDRATARARDAFVVGETAQRLASTTLTDPTTAKVRAYVAGAVEQGLTTDEAVRKLVGTRSVDGLLDKPRATVKAYVRTLATHHANTSKIESYKALGVTHVRFLATLDARTTIQCASLDGEVFAIDDAPVPPIHYGCRSVLLPMLDPNAKPFGTRAALGGQVPATTTFEEWLRSQTREEQRMVLGATRAELWRAGKLPIRDMVGKDLAPLTIDELRRLDRIPRLR